MSPNNKVRAGARSRSRRLLLQALYQWKMSGEETSGILKQYLHDEKMKKADADYFQLLWNAITSDTETLEKQMEGVLDRPIKELDPIELAILWLGTYELSNCSDIPYRVIINESLELAKSFGATDSFKYVNGILDQLAKVTRPNEYNC